MIEQSGEQAEQERGAPSDAERRGSGLGSGLGGFGAGMLVGAVLGIGLGILFAPERGMATRRQLRKRLAQLRERAGDGVELAGKRTRKELARRRRRLEEAVERMREGR
jgi:gas vesicle protein